MTEEGKKLNGDTTDVCVCVCVHMCVSVGVVVCVMFSHGALKARAYMFPSHN